MYSYHVCYYKSCSPSDSALHNAIDYLHILSPKTPVVSASCFISAGYWNDTGHRALAKENQVSKPDFRLCRKSGLKRRGSRFPGPASSFLNLELTKPNLTSLKALLPIGRREWISYFVLPIKLSVPQPMSFLPFTLLILSPIPTGEVSEWLRGARLLRGVEPQHNHGVYIQGNKTSAGTKRLIIQKADNKQRLEEEKMHVKYTENHENRIRSIYIIWPFEVFFYLIFYSSDPGRKLSLQTVHQPVQVRWSLYHKCLVFTQMLHHVLPAFSEFPPAFSLYGIKNISRSFTDKNLCWIYTFQAGDTY